MQLVFPFTYALSVYLDNLMITLWVFYVFFPILDYLLPHDNENPDPKLERALEKDKRFLIPLYLGAIQDFLIYIPALYIVST